MNIQKLFINPKLHDRWLNLNSSWIIWVSQFVLLAISAWIVSFVYPSVYVLWIIVGYILLFLLAMICANKPVWVLYVALFVVFFPAGVIPDYLQSILNRLLTIAAFGSWLSSLFIYRSKVLWSGTAMVMLGFIAWSMATVYWVRNLDVATTILQVYVLRFLFFLILIPNVIRTLKNLDGLLITMALCGWAFLLISAISLLQKGYSAGERFKVFGVNENEAGLLALLMLVGVLWLTTISTSKVVRTITFLMAYIFVISSIGIVAMSGSRGSAISLLITLLAFWFWRPTRRWGNLGLFILLVAGIIAPSLFLTTLERFSSSSGSLLGEREILWQAAWRLISDHPLGGVGVGGSAYAILPYIRALIGSEGAAGISVHNPILVVWSETGMVGLILYLGVLVSAFGSFVWQYFRFKVLDTHQRYLPYFAIVSSVLFGYMASWIKGGGMQTDFNYFLLLSLLLIPSGLDVDKVLDHDK